MFRKRIIFLLLLLIAITERLWFDLGPNVELVMVASVLASMYLGREWGAVLAVMSLVLSDLVIGNTMIVVFTWSAFAVIGFGGNWISKWKGNKQVVAAGGYGLISALWFYFYTNFGVWLMGGMYKKTFVGLMKSYQMGLPFLRIHAVSSVLLVGGGVLAIQLVREILRISNLTIKTLRV